MKEKKLIIYIYNIKYEFNFVRRLIFKVFKSIGNGFIFNFFESFEGDRVINKFFFMIWYCLIKYN